MHATGILALTMVMAGVADAAPNEVRLPNQDFEGEKLVSTLWPSESQSKAELDASMAHRGNQSLRVTAVRASDRAIVNTSTNQFRTEACMGWIGRGSTTVCRCHLGKGHGRGVCFGWQARSRR